MNVTLLKALAANLEASHRIVSVLVDEAQGVERKEVIGKLGDLFSAIAGKVEAEAAVEENNVRVSGEANVQAEAAAPVAVPSVKDVLLEKLNDPRYTLRSVSSLIADSGFDGDEYDLCAYLEDDLDLEIVAKNRRSDGAKLVGLASRN